jgi:site-specific recombinase XerD
MVTRAASVIKQLPSAWPLSSAVEDFLEMLESTNRSAHTITAYRGDLAALVKLHPQILLADVTAEILAALFTGYNDLAPATRSRKQAAFSSFFDWAIRQDYIDRNPMAKFDRVKLPPPAPRGVNRKDVQTVLAVIPADKLRDKVLFRLIFETGLRAGEAVALHVEDLDLRQDDEHMSVLGKGQKRRTVLLDDRSLVTLLRKYLKETGYKNGPLFRAEKNGTGDGLGYHAAQVLWQNYCKKAGIKQKITLHQLRHTHATELINDGVSLTTIKRRLGHANMQTTLRYAEQSDLTADKELREWRRRKQV